MMLHHYFVCKLHTGILLLQQSDLAMYVKAQRVLHFQQLNFHYCVVHFHKYELQKSSAVVICNFL